MKNQIITALTLTLTLNVPILRAENWDQFEEAFIQAKTPTLKDLSKKWNNCSYSKARYDNKTTYYFADFKPKYTNYKDLNIKNNFLVNIIGEMVGTVENIPAKIKIRKSEYTELIILLDDPNWRSIDPNITFYGPYIICSKNK